MRAIQPTNTRPESTLGRATIASAAGACALATLAGCALGYREGGNNMSLDRHVYVSDSANPKSVELVDWRDNNVLWSYDVPVGQKLVVQFYRGDKKSFADQYPDEMRWNVFGADATGGDLKNSLAVPGRDSRRLQWRLRPAPEFPPAG